MARTKQSSRESGITGPDWDLASILASIAQEGTGRKSVHSTRRDSLPLNPGANCCTAIIPRHQGNNAVISARWSNHSIINKGVCAKETLAGQYLAFR